MNTLSPRPQRIVREALALFTGMLQPEIPALLDRLQAELARSTSTRDCCVEALRVLRMRSGEFHPAMAEALDRGTAQVIASRFPATPAVAAALPATTTLRLLDDESVDEEGALAAVAARHEHRASLALLLLGQRFGVLLGSPPLPASALPIGPHALGKALAFAAQRIGLCLHARMALYRLSDTELMSRYPGFAEAVDACIDRAGVLPGLAFVPLRPKVVPAHAGRGRDRALEGVAASATETSAAKVVNEALGALRQVATLPEALVAERNILISAMTGFLLRHGQDSSEWRDCIRHARALLDAVRRGEPAPAEVRDWIGNALCSVGYSAEDARKVASSLTGAAGLPVPQRKAAATRSAREQRCLERLAALPVGTRLGLSTDRGGFMRGRLRYYYAEPGLLLLANEENGQEGFFEIDAVARQMAAGQAWVIRHSPAAPGSEAGADRANGGGGRWPAHIRMEDTP